MRVVVAGGLGFIGTHVVRELTGEGNEIVIAERGEVELAIAAAPTYAVVWAAGHRADNAELMRDQHVRSAMAAIATADIQRFVYLSTGELYGSADVPFRVGEETGGSHPYAVAKAEGEQALARYAQQHGIALVTLRLSLVYGPGQSGPMFLPTLIANVRDGEPVDLTPGEQTRDYVFVEDVARAVHLALQSETPAGTFNIGSGVETRLRDVGAAIVDALDADPALLRWGALPYRTDAQMRYVFDTSRARATLGFEAQVSLAEGIRRTVSV